MEKKLWHGEAQQKQCKRGKHSKSQSIMHSQTPTLLSYTIPAQFINVSASKKFKFNFQN